MYIQPYLDEVWYHTSNAHTQVGALENNTNWLVLGYNGRYVQGCKVRYCIITLFLKDILLLLSQGDNTYYQYDNQQVFLAITEINFVTDWG